MRKRILTALVIPLALALLCELLLFNFSALTSLGKSWTPLPAPEVTGELATDKRVSMKFQGLDQEVQRLHLAIEVIDDEGWTGAHLSTLKLNFSDEGNVISYSAGKVEFYAANSRACYFQLQSYGKIHDLEAILESNNAAAYRLVAAEINGNIPFRISLSRLFLIFLLLVLVLLPKLIPELCDNQIWNRGSWRKALSVCIILVINLALIFCLEFSNVAIFTPKWPHHTQYQRLAHSLREGKTWIDSPEQSDLMQQLAELDNPYDIGVRRKALSNADQNATWDTAFYGKHLYVYFGIVPELLTYFPFYLLTGRDLPTAYVAWFSYGLILVGAFLCLRALIRRYFPRLPFLAYLTLSLLLGNCTGVLSYAATPSFYTVPVAFALAFVLFALALWISAAERWALMLGRKAAPADPALLCFAPLSATPQAKETEWRIALGGLCAALVAGCRPQFLVFTALALPIFLPLMRCERCRSLTLRRMLLFALPYLAVAIPLMYYNFVRFGSPFDFGANYNVTTNDMTRRGFKLTRLPDGLFHYLFALPNLQLKFPFFHPVPFSSSCFGKTIHENMFGGALVSFPFLWLLFAVRRVRGRLRQKQLWLFFWLSLALAVLVVVADTEMAGILWRYTGDYLMLLYLPATLVCCSLLEQANARRQIRLTQKLVLLSVVSLTICTLIAISDAGLGTIMLEMLN
ncbi:MAG: hypothetical protein IIY70_02435 [Oscillospiraceae bacterium]|nr:hypothetical protein [Oscillospiraceae bacterium]